MSEPAAETPFEPVDFGPIPTEESEFIEQAKTEKRKRKNPFSDLGNNDRKVRGAPRKLTTDDRERLLGMYGSMALVANMLGRHETGRAILENAERCVDADMKLAERNNSVRRIILAMMETGAMSEFVLAHLPIFATLIPAGAWSRLTAFVPNGGDDTGNNGQPISMFWAGMESANGDRP